MGTTFDELKPTYDRDGFVVVRNLLSGDELAKLTTNLDRYIREVVPGLPDGDAFFEDRDRPDTLKQMQHMQSDPYFRDYVDHPTWKSLAEALVGEDARADSTEWFNKPPGSSRVTPPHQDNYYFCLAPPNVVTLWMALDRVDDENGCLRYIPGSHRKGFRTHGASPVLGFSQGITDYGPQDEAAEVKIHLEPGDVTAHHGMLIHRAEANNSPTRQRRAFAMVFRGQSCQRDEEAFARYQAACKAQHEAMGLAT